MTTASKADETLLGGARQLDDTRMDIVDGDKAEEERVPRTMQEAIQTFFLSAQHCGPPLAALSIVYFATWRLELDGWSSVSLLNDVLPFAAMIAFWSFQEHAMHNHLLHSKFDWLGKQIHKKHHERPFYHVSIDPAPLMLGWLAVAHLLLRSFLPLPVALSATIGYTGAGLFYEWTHFIVHTRVRFKPDSYWQSLKNHQ